MRFVTLVAVAFAILSGPTVANASEPAAVGTFRAHPCRVDLQTTRHVDCGSIRLPQVRSDPAQGTVRIEVAIARARHALPDPILFVMGGPDYPGVDSFSTFYLGHKAFSRNRDWILFDARGTGRSQPG